MIKPKSLTQHEINNLPIQTLIERIENLRKYMNKGYVLNKEQENLVCEYLIYGLMLKKKKD